MIKKILFQIHWFLGITAGLILSIIGITGAIYSYDQQILEWANPESYTVQVENTAKLTPTQIYQHFQQQKPEMQINSITIAQAANASSSINIVKEGARKGKNILINPYNAEILPEIKGQAFFQFIQQIHRYLTLGDVGKQITGACTLMLIFFVLSGLYLRWPKKHSLRQWLAIKPKLKGRNFLWDLHAVVGTWLVVFYLTFAVTGLFWSYDWWRSGMYSVMNVSPPTKAKNNEGKNKKDQQKMTAEQTAAILNKSWAGFSTQMTRPYSSVTFNLPKKLDDNIELSFVDQIPQHERASNKAKYNNQLNKLENIELYQDKKLNEKIMSSMLPVHRGSFFGPIIHFLFMLAALLMPLFFITGTLLYLKRRKQKRLVLAARNAELIVQADHHATNWLIIYASQTGTAEQLAWSTANSLKQAKQAVEVSSIQKIKAKDLLHAENILFIASTYGTGEAPDAAQHFFKKIMSTHLDLSQLQFAVLALGSKEYSDSYCAFGHQLNDWLIQCGATALFPLVEVSNAEAHDIANWNHALTQLTAAKLDSVQLNKVLGRWQLQQREQLNPGSLGAPVYRVKLKNIEAHTWQAGDIAVIQPANSQSRLQAFAEQHLQLQQHSVQQLEDALWDRDLTQPMTSTTDLAQLRIQLPQLASREYSIASIPAQHSLDLIIRQKVDEKAELGLGSGWLTEYCPIGAQVHLYIRNNPNFHLIEDHRPIICIGNGTGIAGLMSLLSARITAQDYDNWLIFGERQRHCDFYYQTTLENWLETGKLQHLDLAFSRDQVEKQYVHHRLREQAERLSAWIARGAVIYICGSQRSMAQDVEQALIDILGADQVEQLRQDGRYRRDVY